MFANLNAARRYGLCGLVLSASAAAQPAAVLDPVVVTASREPLPAGQVAGDVVVIDAERIRDSGADSVEDLLRREAGIQMSRNGGPGASPSVLIRGAATVNTLVLIDGVRIGSATLGQTEFEALSLGSIERIEVLRGPASSLYGADGTGGVVHIFTRRGGAVPRASVRAAAGGYGAREASADASGKVGAVDLAAGVTHEQLRGVSALRPGDAFGNYNPDDDGFRRTTAQAQIGWQLAPAHRVAARVIDTRLNAQYDASEFPPPSFAQDATPDFRNRLDTQVAALDWRANWSPQWTSTLRVAKQDSDSHTGGNLTDRFRTKRDSADAQATWLFAPRQQLTLAWEGLRERAASTSYLADVQRDNDALVLAYAGGWGPFSVQADARHDDNSVYGGVDTGRLGAALALAPGWRVRALAGNSFRAPSFNDLYFPGYGVPTIRPERSRSIEFGVDAQFEAWDFSATVYRNRARDLIAFESDRTQCPADPSYDFGCARNIGRAKLQGATLAGGARLGAWKLRGVLDFVDAHDAITGQRLARRAAHQASLSADYDAGAWSAGIALLDLGTRPDGGRTLAAYTLVDLRARWRLAPQWALEAKLLNATDRDYEPARDYRPLGRQAWIAVRWDWEGR